MNYYNKLSCNYYFRNIVIHELVKKRHRKLYPLGKWKKKRVGTLMREND